MDLLVLDPVSGRQTGLDRTVKRVLKALRQSRTRFCVIGATTLAVRGLRRMTRDLDIAVLIDDGRRAVEVLAKAGLKNATPIHDGDDLEFMITFVDPKTRVEVDLLICAGDPEATVIEQAPTARVFGVSAKVATLEHLLLMYLYSNQPRHLGDFASGQSRSRPASHAPRDARRLARPRQAGAQSAAGAVTSAPQVVAGTEFKTVWRKPDGRRLRRGPRRAPGVVRKEAPAFARFAQSVVPAPIFLSSSSCRVSSPRDVPSENAASARSESCFFHL